MDTGEASRAADPLWPRASDWITPFDRADSTPYDLGVVGVPAHSTSISRSDAHLTPAAIRAALSRFSTFSSSRDLDVSSLRAVDLGDIADPDGPEGEARVAQGVSLAAVPRALLVALGGDNSITYSVMHGLFGGRLPECGLITVDAHHDLRNGESNGSPVRRLIDAGLPGENIVQIGIADFSNSNLYAERARAHGITVISRAELRERSLASVAEQALNVAGAVSRDIYVDLDVDVCDRSFAPACPAAAPGGISADELRQIAFLLAKDERVRCVDITEVDALADAHDERTVRLAALLVLEVAAGLRSRRPAAGGVA